MTYSEKLKDPRWQRKRLQILERDNFTCSQCGDTEDTLHVHHICYPKSRNPWDSDNDTLVTYCAPCHSLHEYFKKNLECVEIVDVIKVKHQDYCNLTCITYNESCQFYVSGFSYENCIIDFDKFIIPIGHYFRLEGVISKWRDYIKKHATNG